MQFAFVGGGDSGRVSSQQPSAQRAVGSSLPQSWRGFSFTLGALSQPHWDSCPGEAAPNHLDQIPPCTPPPHSGQRNIKKKRSESNLEGRKIPFQGNALSLDSCVCGFDSKRKPLSPHPHPGPSAEGGVKLPVVSYGVGCTSQNLFYKLPSVAQWLG